ncbi:unnamed protein product [Soboliphyme baturini]|uniref:MH1 domain-containing protein n=1 Tax=Soboliphyme baturini TaxID=241478 RepID=A0A183IPP4_9BILA|nr:unnamed protein product [Soboliphyme baturini]
MVATAIAVARDDDDNAVRGHDDDDEDGDASDRVAAAATAPSLDDCHLTPLVLIYKLLLCPNVAVPEIVAHLRPLCWCAADFDPHHLLSVHRHCRHRCCNPYHYALYYSFGEFLPCSIFNDDGVRAARAVLRVRASVCLRERIRKEERMPKNERSSLVSLVCRPADQPAVGGLIFDAFARARARTRSRAHVVSRCARRLSFSLLSSIDGVIDFAVFVIVGVRNRALA